MPSKFFIIDKDIKALPKEKIQEIEEERLQRTKDIFRQQEDIKKRVKESGVALKHTPGRVIVMVDMEEKNSHRFEDGTVIRRERKFNEFNQRIVQPVNAYVVSAENTPTGSEILISHNAVHDTHRIFNYKQTSSTEQVSDIRYFSLREEECYAWMDEFGDWQPMKNYEFALRVFRPYEGVMQNIPPTKIKDVLLVMTGNLIGKVVHVLTASDYQIVFQEKNGREGNLIRFRHSEDESFDREEVVAIADDLTELYHQGKLLVGLTESDAKPIQFEAYAD